MGFFSKSVKGALVAKVASEARKPHNQAKAKSMLSSLRARVSGKGSATPTSKRAAKTTTRGDAAKGSARKGTSRPR